MTALAQALGLSFAAGISAYATAALGWAIWSHPRVSLAAALALLVLLFLVVRALWRAVGRALRAILAAGSG